MFQCSFRRDLMVKRAAYYADAVHRRGGALGSCVGFMDGTKIQIARPGGRGTFQRSVISGNKRIISCKPKYNQTERTYLSQL